jgi:hypothetical protein
VRRRRWMAPLLLLGVLAGCGGDADPGATADPRRPPRLGAGSPAAASPPGGPMSGLERPVAERLAPELADDGLHLEYVECPAWSRTVPAVLECQGYVDGVVAEVRVKLSPDGGGGVEFDAWLGHGLVATTRLVDRLERNGFTQVDCGRVRAYPARVGLTIVCRVHEGGRVSLMEATVTDRAGHVRIEGY